MPMPGSLSYNDGSKCHDSKRDSCIYTEIHVAVTKLIGLPAQVVSHERNNKHMFVCFGFFCVFVKIWDWFGNDQMQIGTVPGHRYPSLDSSCGRTQWRVADPGLCMAVCCFPHVTMHVYS